MFFFNSLYLQRVLGYGPLEAGLAFLPFTGGIILSAGFASQFAPKFGVRPVAIGGMIVTAAGMLLLTQLPVGRVRTSRTCCPALVLTSLGLGCVFVPLTLVATTGLVERGSGPRVGSVQHLAADRRRARARDPLDARGEQDGERRRASRSRRRSWTASTSRSSAGRSSSCSRSSRTSRCSGGATSSAIEAEAATVPIGMTELRADAQRNLDRVLDAACDVLRRAGRGREHRRDRAARGRRPRHRLPPVPDEGRAALGRRAAARRAS